MIASSGKRSGNRAGVWLAVSGVLVVLVWRLAVLAFEYFTEPRVVRELCAVREFKQEPHPNRANTRFVFCQDTEAGMGLFFCDTAGGKPRLLCEQPEKGRRGRRFAMLGWSPDDRLFACAQPRDAKDEEWVLIFDGQTGEPAGEVGVDRDLYQFGWLSNDAIAYATRKSVRTVTRQANGSWTHQRNFQNVATNLDDFTAVSANVVAWRDRGGIWMLDLGSRTPQKVWQATTNRLVQFTHARSAEDFLLNCRDAAGQYLLRLHPQDGRVVALGRIGGPGDFVRDAVWTGAGSRYAFVTNDLAGSAFWVKTAEMAAPALIPWRGGIHRLTLNGSQVFFTGHADNEAPGVWTYDVKEGGFKCVFSTASAALKHGLRRPSTTGAFTNSLGAARFYHLWSPSGGASGRKRPILLAQEHNSWFPYFQLAAHLGFHVAVVDRPREHTWDGDLPHTWAEDVGPLYDLLARRPDVDTNRVYLYACSRDTSGLCQLVSERPALTKGMILFSPSALPDPARLRDQSLLIVAGKADAWAGKQLAEFQDRAAKEGNAVTVFLQDGAQHMPASGATERNRARQFVRFLADQR